MSVSVKIDESQLVYMLMDRLSYWTDDPIKYDLFRQMYESYVENGCFEGWEFDVMNIVDNDYVNNCSVVYPEDEEFSSLDALYEE